MFGQPTGIGRFQRRVQDIGACRRGCGVAQALTRPFGQRIVVNLGPL
jgi:hypothetical protein